MTLRGCLIGSALAITGMTFSSFIHYNQLRPQPGHARRTRQDAAGGGQRGQQGD